MGGGVKALVINIPTKAAKGTQINENFFYKSAKHKERDSYFLFFDNAKKEKTSWFLVMAYLVLSLSLVLGSTYTVKQHKSSNLTPKRVNFPALKFYSLTLPLLLLLL